MDFSPSLSPIIRLFWFLVPVILLLTVVKSSWFKGRIGEYYVNYWAKTMLDSNVYHLIKNVTLPTADGTTQIDHIIVSIYGVFVLETKNFTGWIFGSKYQKHWTQQIYNSRVKFQNPLHQNHKHVKTLGSLHGLDDQQLYSVIVFVGSSTFKTIMPDNVTYKKECIKYILSKTEPLISPAKTIEIINKISEKRMDPSLKTDIHHIKHVRGNLMKRTNNHNSKPKKNNSGLIKFVGFIVFVLLIIGSIRLMYGVLNNMGEQFLESSQTQVGEAKKKLSQTTNQSKAMEKLKLQVEKNRMALIEQQGKQGQAELAQQLRREITKAWDKYYIEPEDCLSYKSEAHMIDCTNKRIRSKREFTKQWNQKHNESIVSDDRITLEYSNTQISQ